MDLWLKKKKKFEKTKAQPKRRNGKGFVLWLHFCIFYCCSQVDMVYGNIVRKGFCTLLCSLLLLLSSFLSCCCAFVLLLLLLYFWNCICIKWRWWCCYCFLFLCQFTCHCRSLILLFFFAVRRIKMRFFKPHS